MRTFVLDETGKNRSTLEGGQDGMAEKEGAIEVACEIETLADDSASMLGRDECLALLSSVDVGRVVYTDGALPAVTPVNFVLNDERVVIRTAVGSRLARRLPGSIVAFEADELDRLARSGWSVVATGHCQRVTDPARLEVIERLALAPWVGGSRSVVLEITATLVTGRRIVPTASAEPGCPPLSKEHAEAAARYR